MSVEGALAFLQAAPGDAEIQHALAACKGRNAIATLISIANEAGYNFDEADYREAIRILAQGELDPEALQQVLRDAGFEE
ncbi:MAG: Nif11-like leader peptide family natural product precursor [Candidatus Hydrogenedens sp.]|nr:Nif11-like leader peptide family natural product precursor [Candidatus Hydrogenedens sp.]